MIETVMEDLAQEYQEESSLSQSVHSLDELIADVLSVEAEPAIQEHKPLVQEEVNLPEINATPETHIPLCNQKQSKNEEEDAGDSEIMSLMEFKPNESGLTSEKKEETKKKAKKGTSLSKSACDSLTAQLNPEESSDTASIIEMPVNKNRNLKTSNAPPPVFSSDGNTALDVHAHQENQISQSPSIQISLQQSEHLRLAQERMTSMEEEIERLRKENEELITTSDIFKERLDKILAKNDDLKRTHEETREEFAGEKRTLMETLSDQSREIDKLQVKNKELEKRLSSNLQHIRIRERELENRLELVKVDTQTLIREKNRYILQLKQQAERTKMDLDTHKNKYSELKQTLEEHSEQSRRAVRGIQMAAQILKGHSLSQNDEESAISKREAIKTPDEND